MKVESMRLILLPLLLMIPACSPQAAEQAPAAANQQSSVHPESGLQVVPLTITSLGRTHTFRVEVARTPAEQAKGLMFRTEMGPNEGMIFPYDPPRVLSFWMKNTVLSLDLVFIGPDHRVINIAANAVPYSEESILSDAPAIATLELNAGRARELSIVPGAKVEW
jgi:uncharacterized membrane protein (UPF0127 family)